MHARTGASQLQATGAAGLGCVALGCLMPNSWVVHGTVAAAFLGAAAATRILLSRAAYLNTAAALMVVGSASLVADCVDGGFKDIRQDKPTARCSDGTYSYSANRRGTCSWHGGVAEWHPYIPPEQHPWWLGF